MKINKYYKNTIILTNGSLIFLNSLKNKNKYYLLTKDNYSKSYLFSLKDRNIINLSNETKFYSFIKKFKKN